MEAVNANAWGSRFLAGTPQRRSLFFQAEDLKQIIRLLFHENSLYEVVSKSQMGR